MKKISTILLSLLLLLALSACTNNNQGKNNNVHEKGDAANNTVDNHNVGNSNNYISRERAIEIALSHAGLTQDDVYDLDAELDKEQNGVLWEVDFDTREFEYSYDINATTEEIVIADKEKND